MKIEEISAFLESIAPSALKESYDNVGLLVGDHTKEVDKAIICLDLTEEVLDEAIKHDCNMVISHHPLIFGGLKKITGSNPTERIVMKAIMNDIAVYAIHTNLDNVNTGVNAILCRKLGVKDPEILSPVQGILSKLVTFCPSEYAEKLREALFTAGAGHIGNYDSCSYNINGYGTFRAGENTDPFVGEKGKLHKEDETRIEVIFPGYRESHLISALKESHPYEEVAYDIYPLKNELAIAGAGMIGMLDTPTGEKTFLANVKKVLGTGVVRHSPLRGKTIVKVAVCGGSGSFLIGKAISAGADIFVTGDVKYHQFFDGGGKMIIADAGHYETEQFTKELLYSILNEKFPTFALRISQTHTNAVHYF
ncbi:MAG TPA: Nif3-like dinuclear metal center hexameric protein [Bacteroidales bacterium]|nr:Nif3-like dinuclear metal center hexameric protein [Bacteroidales bacterium]